MIFLQKEHFDITGMTCSACSSRVEKAVGKLPGIINHSVNLLKNSMVVEFDEKLLSTNEIIQAVEKAGYGASLHYNQSLSKQSPTKIENKAEDIHTQMKKRLFISIIFMLPLFYISMGHMFFLTYALFTSRYRKCSFVCFYSIFIINSYSIRQFQIL